MYILGKIWEAGDEYGNMDVGMDLTCFIQDSIFDHICFPFCGFVFKTLRTKVAVSA